MYNIKENKYKVQQPDFRCYFKFSAFITLKLYLCIVFCQNSCEGQGFGNYRAECLRTLKRRTRGVDGGVSLTLLL